MLLSHMRDALRFSSLLIASLVAVSAQAAVFVNTVPANPVAGVPFVIHAVVGNCPTAISNATINGANIDFNVTYAPCIETPPVIFDLLVGPLPAGAYTVRFLTTDPPSVETAIPPTVVVAAADVPALDPLVLAMLAVTLIGVAMLKLRIR